MKWLGWIVFSVTAAPLWAFVEEVQNGKKPKGPAYTLKFEEDLRFGADEDGDEYIWGLAATSISVDGRGHMYIADPRENRIMEFDAEGEFIKLVAKSGQGPGELQGLFNFTFLKNGKAVAVDLVGGSLPKFKYFDENLAYLEEKGLDGLGLLIQAVTWSPLGDQFGAIYIQIDQAKGNMNINTGIIDNDFKIVKEYTSATRPLPDPSRFSDSNYWAEFIGGNLKAFQFPGIFNYDWEGNLYAAVSNRYEVTIWSPGHKQKQMVVKREYNPIPNNQEHLNAIADGVAEQFRSVPQVGEIITQTVMRKAIELSEPPPVKAPIFGIIAMDGGRFLVIHDVQVDTRINVADIYSEKGAFLGQVKMADHAFMAPATGAFLHRMVFRNGFAYTVETDEYGENRAVRYRYELVKL